MRPTVSLSLSLSLSLSHFIFFRFITGSWKLLLRELRGRGPTLCCTDDFFVINVLTNPSSVYGFFFLLTFVFFNVCMIGSVATVWPTAYTLWIGWTFSRSCEEVFKRITSYITVYTWACKSSRHSPFSFYPFSSLYSVVLINALLVFRKWEQRNAHGRGVVSIAL